MAKPEAATGPIASLNDELEARLRDLERVVVKQQNQVQSLQQELQTVKTSPTSAAVASPVAETKSSSPKGKAAKESASKDSKDDSAKPYEVGSDLKMEGVWNNGLEFRTRNKDFYFHVGGRTQWDNTYLDSNNDAAALANTGTNNDALQDASFFRRARLRMEGSMYETIDWVVEYNFVNSFSAQDPTAAAPQINGGFQNNTGVNISTAQSRVFNPVSPVDLWWNIREVPFFGNIQMGNMKEPFSLERLESSRYLDFMERNFGGDAFVSPSANGFAPGIMAWNWLPSRRGTYAYGLFKNVTNPFAFNVGDGQGEVAGRATYLLWYDEPSGGRYFTHVGIGAASRAIDNQVITYRSRGALRNGPDALIPSFANTNAFAGTSQNIVNPECMFQYGPLFVQSEFISNWTTNSVALAGTRGNVAANQNLGTTFFYSGYIQVMYFLTGENRIYDYQKGLVGRVVPRSNAFFVRGQNGRVAGPGAWQVGARLNYLNLNNKGVQGGTLNGMTFALNWFLNPNMKIQANFDVTHRDAAAASNGLAGAGTEGIIYGLGTRVAADF